jgi:hypothetical protein
MPGAAPGGFFGLDGRQLEILVEWLTIAAGSDYEPAFPRLRAVLARVGRMKYLRPLYLALGKHPRTRQLARSIFAEAHQGYHSLSRRVAESLIEKYPADRPELAAEPQRPGCSGTSRALQLRRGALGGLSESSVQAGCAGPARGMAPPGSPGGAGSGHS